MSEIEKIYCVHKTTSYRFHHASEEAEAKFARLPELMRKRICASHENHHSFVERLQGEFDRCGLNWVLLDETKIDEITPTSNDLLISCGGDGMFLSCAQKFSQCRLLGMNTDFQPENPSHGSAGALTSVNYLNLNEVAGRLKEGKWKLSNWQRLGAEINGEPLKNKAVNDIYFGSQDAFKTCSVRLGIENIEGTFLCTGVLTCTGMGSHAWFSTAGGTPFSNELNAFGVKVMWPNKNHENAATSGIFSDRNRLIIRPNRNDYILSFDSKPDFVTTSLDDKIEIFLDKETPLRVVEFP